MENARRASVTDSVPSAESLRPLNGNVSGPRWHWLLMFTRQTWLTSGSMSRLKPLGSLPNSVGELPAERVDQAPMGEDHLDRRAALAVEGQGPQHALADRQVEVRIGEDHGGVLGLQAKHAAEAVRVGVLVLELGRGLRG